MSIDPKILKFLEGETTFQQTQNNGSRRVRIERGQSWLLRFLPARMGPNGLWVARIGRHWNNKTSILCPRTTHPDFGGDPDAECPVCAAAEELNGSSDQAISTIGYKSRANAQYLTYCVVYEKNGSPVSMSELLIPYEFWHYATTWEELKGFYIAGGRKSPLSILDYETGNDFTVIKTAKGLRLDKCDSQPLFNSDEPRREEYIRKIEGYMKSPRKIAVDTAALTVFANKLIETAERAVEAVNSAPARRVSRPTGHATQDANADIDPDSAVDTAPPRRSRPPVAANPDDDLPYDDPTPAQTAGRAPAVTPRAAQPPQRRTVPEPEVAQAPASRQTSEASRRTAPTALSRRNTAPMPEPELSDTPEPELPEAAEASDADVEDADLPPEADAEVPPAKPAARKSASPAPLAPTARRQQAQASNVDTDDDPLPEDDKDSIAPSATAGDVDAPPPPPVARAGSQSAAIRDRIAANRANRSAS